MVACFAPNSREETAPNTDELNTDKRIPLLAALEKGDYPTPIEERYQGASGLVFIVRLALGLKSGLVLRGVYRPQSMRDCHKWLAEGWVGDLGPSTFPNYQKAGSPVRYPESGRPHPLPREA